MTSSNPEGNGRPHGNRLPADFALPALPASREHGGKEPSPGSAPAAATGAVGDSLQVSPPAVPLPRGVAPPLEASVSGLELPGEFSTAHFLDPAFLTQIANDLYAEVEPGLSSNDPESATRHGFDNLPATGEGARQATAFERFDFQDPRLFQGLGEAPIPQDGKGAQRPSMGEDFYFLSPPAAAAAEAPSFQAPSPGVLRTGALNSPAGASPPLALPGIADPTAFFSHGSQGLAVPTPPVPMELPAAVNGPMPAMLPVSTGVLPRDFRKAEAPGLQEAPSALLSMAPLNSPSGASHADGVPGLTDPSGVAPPVNEGFYFLTPALPAEPLPTPAAGAAPSSQPFSVERVRKDFPILQQRVHGKPLIWLDNAATTQKPRQVIDAVSRFYERDNSNIHRAAHTLAARATTLYEEARDKVRGFLGAGQVEEIVFVHGATEAINLVAQTYGRKFIEPGDEIVVSAIEHHANIVPWQQLIREKGAVLRVVPVNDRGEILLDAYESLLGPRTKLVAVTQVSNALGTVLPVRTMAQMAHRHGAKVLIDGAQSTPHMAIDVQQLDCDFFVVAGHKLFAPTGIGVLYGKRELLEAMPPWQGGGNMIDQVTFEESTFQQSPAKFEAGTGILAGAIGLGAAIDYLDDLGMDNISRYEHELLVYATEGMLQVPGLRLIGTAAEKASVLSFVMDGLRNEDVGRYLDQEGIAVRAGHHCAQPTMRRFGLESTVRPSLAFYNTPAEIDALVAALRKLRSPVG